MVCQAGGVPSARGRPAPRAGAPRSAAGRPLTAWPPPRVLSLAPLFAAPSPPPPPAAPPHPPASRCCPHTRHSTRLRGTQRELMYPACATHWCKERFLKWIGSVCQGDVQHGIPLGWLTVRVALSLPSIVPACTRRLVNPAMSGDRVQTCWSVRDKLAWSVPQASGALMAESGRRKVRSVGSCGCCHCQSRPFFPFFL